MHAFGWLGLLASRLHRRGALDRAVLDANDALAGISQLREGKARGEISLPMAASAYLSEGPDSQVEVIHVAAAPSLVAEGILGVDARARVCTTTHTISRPSSLDITLPHHIDGSEPVTATMIGF